MNDLVASSVCWTIATSWRTSSAGPAPGRVATRRSTIWAWRTMLVRLWAGPSCIARAISRRRSSWALRSSRETAGGGAGSALGPAGDAPARPGAPDRGSVAGRRRGRRASS